MSILTNRWAQVVGAITVLTIGFFVYQANNGTETVAEADADVTASEVAEDNTTNETVEVVNTIDNTTDGTPESDAIDPVTETETTEK